MEKSQKSKLKSQKLSFTLIEVLLTISLIALLASFLTPSLDNFFATVKLTQQAREITVFLRKAQSLSLGEQVNHRVEFDSASRTYLMKKIEGETQTILESQTLASGIIFSSINLTNNCVQFNSAGTPVSPCSSGSLVLQNNKGKTKTVFIQPAGFVKVE